MALSQQGFAKAFETWPRRDPAEAWEAEKRAKPSDSHPLAGFWKADTCAHEFGPAIGPSKEGTYFVSFCGPGGCFAPGEYRPETGIVDDPDYRVIDANTIEIKGWQGFTRDIRCPGR